LASCSTEDKIKTYRLPKKSIETSALVEKEKVPSEIISETKKFTLQWTVPSSWEQFDGHSMRMASFYVPYSTGKGELSITEFSGMSGGIQANINRWRGQISLPPETEQSILNSSIPFKSDLGNFLFFELANKKSNQSILASIFELSNRTVFVKLSTEQSALVEVKKDFITFSKSISL
tara:strand:+ start:1572 stop:2102 length:531 start_codon:yes stop_codon:yes gene_type:complete